MNTMASVYNLLLGYSCSWRTANGNVVATSDDIQPDDDASLYRLFGFLSLFGIKFRNIALQEHLHTYTMYMCEDVLPPSARCIHVYYTCIHLADGGSIDESWHY